METVHHEVIIHASKEKVWDALFNEDNYSHWTKFFNEGSQIKSDWSVGGKTYFLGADGTGMVSTIETLDKPNLMVFKHLGTVDQNGFEDTESAYVAEWSGSFEKYLLIDLDGSVKLHAEAQIDKAHRDYIKDSFVKGFQVVKEMAEQC